MMISETLKTCNLIIMIVINGAVQAFDMWDQQPERDISSKSGPFSTSVGALPCVDNRAWHPLNSPS